MKHIIILNQNIDEFGQKSSLSLKATNPNGKYQS